MVLKSLDYLNAFVWTHYIYFMLPDLIREDRIQYEIIQCHPYCYIYRLNTCTHTNRIFCTNSESRVLSEEAVM